MNPDIITNFKILKEKIENNNSFAIFGHVGPDGDAVSSILAIGLILRKLGKSVSYFVPSPTPSNLQFINGIQEIRTDFDFGQYDVLFFVDFHDLIRLDVLYDEKPLYFDQAKKLIIDHHIGELGYEGNALIDVDAVSTCELIREFVNFARPSLVDKQFATYTYIGQVTDSGNFTYDVDHVRSMSNAVQMLKYGVEKTKILSDLFYNKDINYLENYQMLIKRIQTTDKIIWLQIDQKEIDEKNISEDLPKDILIFMRQFKDRDVQVVITIKEDKFRINIRSKITNVQRIASNFGGGGHHNASGVNFWFGRKYTLANGQQLDMKENDFTNCIKLIESFL